MGEENEVVISIQKKFEEVPSLRNEACISRVPKSLRKVNGEAYTPQVVSIGPYHHGNDKLKAMEEHKVRYVSDFFNRDTKPSLEGFVESLKKLEAQARKCYEQPIKYGSNEFVEMMLVDGCFIIELILKCWERKEEVLTNDTLFRTHSTVKAAITDMLLLENQLPYFILEHLFNLYTGFNQNASFLEFILPFLSFNVFLKIAQDVPQVKANGYQPKHFLGLFRDCCLPLTQNTRVKINEVKRELDEVGIEPKKAPQNWLSSLKNGGFRGCCLPPTRKIQLHTTEDNSAIPSATELDAAGVKFRKATEDKAAWNWPWGLEFNSKNGVLEIPIMLVEESTEILLRNLIAYEQCFQPSTEQYITLYVYLMDSLIHSPEDAAKLRHYGIIENMLDNEQVCHLFNNICKGTIIFPNTEFYHTICKNMNSYYNTPWNTFKAMLLREYFYSPWSTASSVAVVIVVMCTIIQTLCSVDSWATNK